KERRAVRPRKHANLCNDGPYRFQSAAVDAATGLQDVAADDLLFKVLEDVGQKDGISRIGLSAFRQKLLEHLLPNGFDCFPALLLLGDRVALAKLFLGDLLDAILELGLVGDLDIPRLLRSRLGQLDDGLDDRLEVAMAEHHS